jgi:hypothetical protein
MSAEKYVEVIMQDDAAKIVRETPVVYEAARLEREYEFKDGAVVNYEWRDASMESFNHQFTLVRPPKPNPKKLSAGVIKTLNY